MGYFTRYSLQLTYDTDSESNDEVKNKVIKKLYEMNLMGFVFNKSLESNQSATWYTYHEDMLCLSTFFPDIIFRLDGYGEDDGDIWREYYLDGKYQKAKANLVFDAFDEEKLESPATK